jgi:glycosyltransferase involved in cell wall biosynthesis
MRLLWIIHLYAPKHNCGSELMAHHINKYLISQGHEVRVILMQAKWHNVQVPYYYEDVRVQGDPHDNLDAYRWADVILTHLDYTKWAINIAKLVKKPIACFIHSHYTYDPNPIPTAKSDVHIVYNSQWVKEALGYNWPNMIMYPPCDADYYNVCADPWHNKAITMISINENKGGYILYRLAKAMPYAKFIGVYVSYDDGGLQDEIAGKLRSECPNVELVPNSPDILSVYKRTRILLMPSRYESWGRTATEAMCNGIPVICTATKGLKENCADAGLYIPDRGPCEADKCGKIIQHDGYTYDIKPIVKHINKLDNEKYYRSVSAACRERAAELNPANQLKQLEQFLINAKHYKGYKEQASGVYH